MQVSVAMGCAARERNVVFASTLASFFTRAYDQLRIAAMSESNINLCGSHCGLSTGKYVSKPCIPLLLAFRVTHTSPSHAFTKFTFIPLTLIGGISEHTFCLKSQYPRQL